MGDGLCVVVKGKQETADFAANNIIRIYYTPPLLQ
jgi:hypothetical protein